MLVWIIKEIHRRTGIVGGPRWSERVYAGWQLGLWRVSGYKLGLRRYLEIRRQHEANEEFAAMPKEKAS